jgi:hypothetical protein
VHEGLEWPRVLHLCPDGDDRRRGGATVLACGYYRTAQADL